MAGCEVSSIKSTTRLLSSSPFPRLDPYLLFAAATKVVLSYFGRGEIPLRVVVGGVGEVSRAEQGSGQPEEGALVLGVVVAVRRAAGEAQYQAGFCLGWNRVDSMGLGQKKKRKICLGI
jgi:hypothetical protein